MNKKVVVSRVSRMGQNFGRQIKAAQSLGHSVVGFFDTRTSFDDVSKMFSAVKADVCIVATTTPLNRTMNGSDQAASIEPAGFRQLVGGVRKIDVGMGDGGIEMNPKEKPVADKLRAHIPS